MTGEKLWNKIERAQGYAYISDAVHTFSKQESVKEAIRSLNWHKQCIKVLKLFIEENKPKKP